MSNNNQNYDQHELDKIRMRKMRELMEAKKREENIQEKSVSIYDKVDFVLKVVLAPNAYMHLNKLKNEEPPVYRYIYDELISPDVIQNIDYLIALIQQRGGIPRKIPLDAIIFLERKAKGIKSKIQVKRGDDMMDLSSFLSKD
ncbi:MAG: hypothetical protein ACFFC3_16755 [Candidatus Odinarchaeota archaeon]